MTETTTKRIRQAMGASTSGVVDYGRHIRQQH